jgi:hypothetical protein
MGDHGKNDDVPWSVRLYMAEQDFVAGIPLAIDECVRACFEGGQPIPEWAMPTLAERAEISLGLKPDPRKKGGQHANPKRAGENRNKQLAAFYAMLVARRYGYKGDKKLDLTQRLLLEQGIPNDGEPYDCETIEKYYKKLKKEFGIDKYPNSYWIQKFELAIANIEYIDKIPNQCMTFVRIV